MNETGQAVVPVAPRPPLLQMGSRGIQLGTFEDAWRFATAVVKTQFVPKGWIAEDVVIAIQYGMEVGLSPMQSLQSIAMINGKPSLYGDAPLALVKQHPQYRGIREWREGKPYEDNYTAYCELKREGDETVLQYFSVAMAKKGQLWGKAGPWQTSPDRMLQFRARGFGIRDQWADVIKGLITEDEARDIDPDVYLNAAPTPGPLTAREVKRYALATPEREASNRVLEREMETAFLSPEPQPAVGAGPLTGGMVTPPAKRGPGRPRKAAEPTTTLRASPDMTFSGPTANVVVGPPPPPVAPEPPMREPGDDTEEVQAERAAEAQSPTKLTLRERYQDLKSAGIDVRPWVGFKPDDMADLIRYEGLIAEAEKKLYGGGK
jgi:hypothetical protein